MVSPFLSRWIKQVWWVTVQSNSLLFQVGRFGVAMEGLPLGLVKNTFAIKWLHGWVNQMTSGAMAQSKAGWIIADPAKNLGHQAITSEG